MCIRDSRLPILDAIKEKTGYDLNGKSEEEIRQVCKELDVYKRQGEGSLKMDNGITFLPNDRYLLENEKFRLYYTAAGEDVYKRQATCCAGTGRAWRENLTCLSTRRAKIGRAHV